MEPSITILRSAAGSPPSVTQYRAFRSLGCRIVAVDCDATSVGFRAADAFYVVPRADDPGYLDRILEICQKESVNLFLPALDEELLVCSRHRDRFLQVGTTVLVSDPSGLEICTDKMATYEFFRSIGVPTPRTIRGGDYRAGSFEHFPVVIKPRAGRGSSNVFVARNHTEAEFFSGYVPDAVVQERLAGVEYTIDVLADMASELAVISPRKRLATDSGISSKGITDWREEFVTPVATMVRALRLVGPLNVQCFLLEDGRLSFTEINARIAGTAILTQAAGVPYFENILTLARGGNITPWMKPAPQMTMYRYWEEIYAGPSGEAGSP